MGKADLFEDLKPQFSKELASFQDLKDAHAKEVNSTQLQISDLLMERSKMSRQLEEVEQKISDIENENGFLIPKKSQLEEKLKKVEQKAAEVEDGIELINQEVEKENTKHEPYQIRIDELEKELKESEAKYSSVKEVLESLEDNFSKLSNIRDIAKKSFLSSKELLLAEMIKPHSLFYDDDVEITVANVAPSKTGFFVKSGRDIGIFADQFFIASRNENFEDEIFGLRCQFADIGLSYFEFVDISNKVGDVEPAEGENLFLKRTGVFNKDVESVSTNN